MLELALEARLLVASLGESVSPPWWRSQAMGATGRGMLAHIFPRTAMSASFQTASRAARAEHDARLNRLGAYHLFRLPPADEATLRDFARPHTMGEVLQTLNGLTSVDAQLEALFELAGGASTTSGQGPVEAGMVANLWADETLPHICGIYHGAFRAGKPAYPYLTGSA